MLERNSRNVVATLETISRDPETLRALQALLVQLLQANDTRAALVQLLLAAFADPQLCAATGTFLLASLDTPAAQAELYRQAAALASATVADEQVCACESARSPPLSHFSHTLSCRLRGNISRDVRF